MTEKPAPPSPAPSDQLSLLKQKVEELEKNHKLYQHLLNSTSSLSSLVQDLRRTRNEDDVFGLANTYLSRFLPWKTMAFLLPDPETLEFSNWKGTPEVTRQALEPVIEEAIEQGSFGWAVTHHRPACLQIKNSDHFLVLTSLKTRDELIAIFVGVLDASFYPSWDITMINLSTSLAILADSIHSHRLSSRLQTEKRMLEETAQRTSTTLSEASSNELFILGSEDGVWEIDPENRTLTLTKSAMAHFGLRAGNGPLLEKDVLPLLHENDVRSAAHALKAHLRGETGLFECTFRSQGPKGDWLWIQAKGKKILSPDNSHPVRIIGTFTDITEKKKAESEIIASNSRLEDALEKARQAAIEADTANHAKSEFLAMMSHEIRTPMNAVIGFAEILGTTTLDEKQKQWVNTIRSSGDALLVLINDILDYSKIESGKLELEYLPVDIRSLCEDVAGLLEPKAALKQVRLTTRIAAEVPTTIQGDVTRLRQVLINLISNAIKFTHVGSVTLQLDIRYPSQTSVPMLQFSVVDTGIGIPDEQQKQLFEPFRQVDSSTTRKYGGTGLGLAICKSLVEMMSGSISLESIPQKGSTFRFMIPVPADASSAPSQKPVEPITYDRTFASRFPAKILLVEDNANNRDVAQTMLEQLGYEIDIAENGLECLRLIVKKTYDIVLLDIHMPQLDGYETIHEIRNTPSLKSLHVVAMTAFAMQGDRQKAIDAGMNDYISKPVQMRQLAAMIERAHSQKARTGSD